MKMKEIIALQSTTIEVLESNNEYLRHCLKESKEILIRNQEQFKKCNNTIEESKQKLIEFNAANKFQIEMNRELYLTLEAIRKAIEHVCSLEQIDKIIEIKEKILLKPNIEKLEKCLILEMEE